MSSKNTRSWLASLYKKPLPSTRTGPLYNAFSYPTKISPESVAIFIASHTKPGDVVLDTFGGRGTTGIATLLCDNPTDEMRHLATRLGISPMWGPREAIIYELSTVGSLAAETMCNPPDPLEFGAAADQLVDSVSRELDGIYRAISPDGEMGWIRYIIWSDVLMCPGCGGDALFWESAISLAPIRIDGRFRCPHCRKEARVEEVRKATEEVFDPLLGRLVTRKKRVPVRVHGQGRSGHWNRRMINHDQVALGEVEAIPLPECIPLKEMEWGDLHRSGYHSGITHVHHFYSRRNLLAIAALWERISEFPENLRNPLRLLVLSYNASHATMMSRVVAKSGLADFVLTGAQTGVLYVSSLPVEKNVFLGIRRKSSTLRRAFATVQGSRSHVRVVNRSSMDLDLPGNSVDYVFTDPPFGDYIPYAEVNQLNEAWLGVQTDRKQEIIVSTSQGKSVDDYGRMIKAVFLEIDRVLKSNGCVTLVFHSAKAGVWQALESAYTDAGFRVKASSVLDKLQSSFKQVVSSIVVKGDPLLLLTHEPSVPANGRNDEAKTDEVINDLIVRSRDEKATSKERSPEWLYSRFVSRCLESGFAVPMNAETFYSRIRAVQSQG